MDFNTILQSISTVGFPIVACVAMFIRMDKSDKAHKEEIDRLSDAINNNTIVMTQLVDKIGGE